ncbi:probable calcium-binding protein CML25 [Salvia hispanica]|uniref:probable calcium-binding protein CML25 n=1 Tax=Salvia hispanica TaxID=49212 RepID=UPI0020095AEB|nr:probable calcium-binding protein CML25 [Salvia hispanica]
MGGLRSLFKKKKQQHQEPDSDSIPSAMASSRMEEELQKVFKKFDANGDGRICAEELGAIMSSLGHPASEEELRGMIREADGDGDGFIDLREFIDLNNTNVDEVHETLCHAFQIFDADNNGTISADELHRVLRSIGEDCSLDDCKRMISGVDIDGSGTIDFHEFKLMMTKGARFDHSKSE